MNRQRAFQIRLAVLAARACLRRNPTVREENFGYVDSPPTALMRRAFFRTLSKCKSPVLR